MRRRRRLEIAVETKRMVVRRGMSQAPVWCAECSAPVQTVTPEEAAALTGVDTSAGPRRAGADRLHFVEAAGRSPLICLNSLLAAIASTGAAIEDTPDKSTHPNGGER